MSSSGCPPGLLGLPGLGLPRCRRGEVSFLGMLETGRARDATMPDFLTGETGRLLLLFKNTSSLSLFMIEAGRGGGSKTREASEGAVSDTRLGKNLPRPATAPHSGLATRAGLGSSKQELNKSDLQ